MLSPAEFVESYAAAGAKKAAAPLSKLFLLGILGGFAIGIGAILSTTAAYSVDRWGLSKIIGGLLFPMGLMIVLLTGAELFTGNCLMTIPLLSRRIGLKGLLRNWATVYLGNFAGALLLAVGIAYSNSPLQYRISIEDVVYTAAVKCSMPFGRALVLGVLCNILVCAAVMFGLSAKSITGRILGVFPPVCCFVICGFEHCVANMYYVPAGLLAMTDPDLAGTAARLIELSYGDTVNLSLLTPGNFILHNLLPVTLGNILGGCAFAALIWYCHRKKD